MSDPTLTGQDEARRALATNIEASVFAFRLQGDNHMRIAMSFASWQQVIAALRAPSLDRGAEEMKGLPRIEFHQQDFIPGFAAFLPGATTPAPDSKAFCVINLGSMLSTVYHGDTAREDLPYFLADSIMHEVIHALEQWAGVEFNEDRVDALIEKYRALPVPADLNEGGGK